MCPVIIMKQTCNVLFGFLLKQIYMVLSLVDFQHLATASCFVVVTLVMLVVLFPVKIQVSIISHQVGRNKYVEGIALFILHQ